MKHYMAGLSLVAGSVVAISTAQADFAIGNVNIGIKPRLTGGAMYYNYTQPTVGVEQAQVQQSTAELQENIDGILSQFGLQPIASEADFTVSLDKPFEVTTWLPTIGGGATFFVDRFFIDASAQHAFKTSDTASQPLASANALFSQGVDPATGTRFDLGASQFARLNENFDVDIDRTEWSISAGYSITDSFSVYAGYKRAETTFEQQGKETTVRRQTSVTVQAFDADGNPIVDPQTGIALSVGGTTVDTLTVSRDIERDFEYDGPFIGAVYGLPISKGLFDGVLALNLAVAFLDGEITETERNAKINGELQPSVKSVIKGDSTGLTLGLSWNGATPVKGLSYVVGIDGYKYDFNGDKVELQGQTIPIDTRFDETVINLRVGASYTF
ncbi:MAG: hypothetical protein ACFCVA_17605 [Gammaproteobacteria bacterium]